MNVMKVKKNQECQESQEIMNVMKVKKIKNHICFENLLSVLHSCGHNISVLLLSKIQIKLIIQNIVTKVNL